LVAREFKKFIIEGPDGCGKTTLCEKVLKNNKNDMILHHSEQKPLSKKMFESQVEYEFSLLANNKNIIMDRSFIISEFIYSRALNRVTYCYDKHIHNLCNIISKYNVDLIFCLAEKPILKDEDFSLPINVIIEEYKNLIAYLKLKNIKLEVIKLEKNIIKRAKNENIKSN